MPFLNNLQGVVDKRIINMIIVLFKHIPMINSLSISALIGLVILLWSASNFFRQLKNFINRAWDIQPTKFNNVKDFLKNVILSFVVVIFFGVLLVVGTIIEGVVYSGLRLSQGFLTFPSIIVEYAGSISSFLVLVLFFMLIYRILPDKSLDFKSIFVGSFVTAILTNTGKYVIELYFTYSNPTSIYGGIGSIIGIFLLVYYSLIMVTIQPTEKSCNLI